MGKKPVVCAAVFFLFFFFRYKFASLFFFFSFFSRLLARVFVRNDYVITQSVHFFSNGCLFDLVFFFFLFPYTRVQLGNYSSAFEKKEKKV